MRKTPALLADYPDVGESYLMRQIQEIYPAFQILSLDAYREGMWGRYGFDIMEGRETDVQKAQMGYYKDMGDMIQMDVSILSDYPFSDKQKSRLGQLATTHTYQIMIVRFAVGLGILYERQRAHDLDDTHHPGHITDSLHKGDILRSRDRQSCMVGYEEFMNRCKSYGYGTFALGTASGLDVADFNRTDYPTLM